MLNRKPGTHCREFDPRFVEVDTVWHSKWQPKRLLPHEFTKMAHDLIRDNTAWPNWLPPPDILKLEPATVTFKGKSFPLAPPAAKCLQKIVDTIHGMQDAR